MTDQTFDAVSPSSPSPARTFEPRSLAPTALFWLAMFVASALGTNIGDFWADDLGLGLPTSFASLAVICALMIWGDRENASRTEVFYWLAIICLRAVATNVGDFLTHTMGMNYLLATILLGAMALVLGYNTVPALGGASPRIDRRYWAAMFVAGIFGTVGGDMVAHSIGLFLAAVLLGALLLGVIRVRNLAAPAAMVGYWCIVLAERAAGTPMGDWLAKSRGLNLGLPISMALVGVLLLLVLSLRAGSRTSMGTAVAFGAAARVLLPALRLVLLVLSLIGCVLMLKIYFVQRPGDPSFVLSYAIGLAANAIYLGTQELASLGSSRTMQLLSLWSATKRRELDRWTQAREAELRERAR